MPNLPHILAACLLAQAAPARDGHEGNPIFRDLVTTGVHAGEATVRLPRPTLPDGQDAEAGLAALRLVAGDDRAAREMLRDSVTAPFILRTRDVKAEDSTIRAGDLWFVVHARLEDIDPERAARQSDDRAVEAGNMRFASKLLKEDDLRGREAQPLPPAEGRKEWFSHMTGRLLDRIAVEATERAVATRTPDSILVAARTEPDFDRDARNPNRWMTITRRGADETQGPAQPYRGAASYVKITRLAAEPGTLLVEAHFAFVEPLGWFQGNPILRSKIGLIAQDQIRRLRRELAKPRADKSSRDE